MRIGWIACLLLGVLAGGSVRPAQAQSVALPAAELGTYRDTLDLAQPPPWRLRPFVLPGSARLLRGAVPLDTTAYRLDHRHGRLWIAADAFTPADTLVVVYRTFPFDFKDVYRRRGVAAAGPADSSGAVQVVEEAAPAGTGFDPFAGTQLQRSGSITRGILAGNNRDVTVESGLRMQLAGEIVDGVNVQAVLTDENTPILPEGTTQRIEEFDRVFIELDAPVGTARLGDFDLQFTGSEFGRFTRKLQGVSVVSPLPAAGAPVLAGGSVAVAGATSRGIFRSQEVDLLDGVQGPYRLEGSSGERFILVLPGSEVVYLDGRRLTRGETNDYTIDYATAEVTFTAHRLITADQRLTVEFQYTTNQFTRTLVGAQAEARFWGRADGDARGRLGATFLREADSRQFSEELGFSAEDSLALIRAGDALAWSSGAEVVTFDPEAAYTQYLLTDDSVYVALRTPPPAGTPVYRVRFSRVGPGQGRYVRVGRSAGGVAYNSIVYEYRGAGLGEYEPVRILPRPRQQRLVDLHGGLSPLPGVELFGEWAQSLHDENRLSPLDHADDLGHAYLAGLRLAPTPLVVGAVGLGRLSAELRRRYTGARFTSFDRIRPVEFGRHWNLSRAVDVTGGVVDAGDEQADEGFVQLDVTPQSRFRAEVGRLRLGTSFEGRRSAATLHTAEAGLPQADYRVEYVTSRDTLTQETGRWLRQLGSVQQPLLGGRLVPRLEVEHEDRRQHVTGTDSLARRSFRFVEYRPGLAWVTETLTTGGLVEWRTEDAWLDGALLPASRAWMLQANVNYEPGRTFFTDASVGYRMKRYTERFRVAAQREDGASMVLRWNSRFQPLRRAVELDGLYEALTERTPTLQEVYVRTGPELGQYVWEDANGDGVIQIDEFLPERTPHEGTYVQTFVPSDALTSVINVQARLRLELDPARLWRGAGARWQRWLARVYTRTTFDVQEKSRDPELAQIYLLNLRRFRDPVNTLNGRLRIAQDVYLFRGEPRYGVDLSFNQLRGLVERAAGEERRLLNSWRFEGRYRPGTRWGVKLVSGLERNRVLSEQFASRRYDIASLRLEPELSFHPVRSVQLLGGLAFARKEDAVGGRTADLWKVPVELRYNRARKLQLTARGELAHVRLDGEALGMAQYELTDGRGPGTSYLWNVTGQYTLSQYLRASFSYDGRAPADAPVIHTVRLELSAIF